MDGRYRIATSLVALGSFVACPTSDVIGGEHSHKHVKSTEATPHTARQAGYPQCVSPISMVSYNEHYSGGFIGGGKAFGGHERCANEGTWGYDYTPFRPMSPRLFLKWSHGRHYQGGGGPYATDGPKPLEHITEAVHDHLGGGE